MDTKLICATVGGIAGSYYGYLQKYGFWQGQAICLAATILGNYVGQELTKEKKVVKTANKKK